jgi:hypothetical protein
MGHSLHSLNSLVTRVTESTSSAKLAFPLTPIWELKRDRISGSIDWSG